MDSVFTAKEYCCGCTACENICPKNAIIMNTDETGFWYPQIDSEKCVDCGLCKKVCQFGKKKIEDANNDINCYALKHKDLSVIKQSRSAGAFTALTDYVIANGGVVYGVVLDADMTVRHHRAENIEQRNRFRESKYVQSNLTGIFKAVLNDLKNGKNVLFSGTGCQCDGLRAFLALKKIETSNLLLVDIVCHGVPSPKIFSEYIKWNEKKYNSTVIEFKFRDKNKYSWGEGIEKLTFQNGKVIYQDYFTDYFFENFIRFSCYECKYTTPYRNSDITLADFWGSEKTCPEFTDYKNGCSLVLVHSEKGRRIFNLTKNDVLMKEISVTECLQPRLETPREKSKDSFLWKIYCEKGFAYIMTKYATNSLSPMNRIKNKATTIVKKIYSVIKRFK